MRALVPPKSVLPGPLAHPAVPLRLEESLARLRELAQTSPSISASSIGEIKTPEGTLPFPRFIFLGPKGGGDTLRVGIFAALHGNEIQGPPILAEFFHALESNPAPAAGFHIYAYPICNPGAFTPATRDNHHGEDLTRQFWRGSRRAEAYYLEREMGVHQFHGVVSLHVGAVDEIGYYLKGPSTSVLHDGLVQPAMAAALSISSLRVSSSVTGGFLTDTTELQPVPFEMNWRMPRNKPLVAVAVLTSLLDSYRTLLALRPNI